MHEFSLMNELLDEVERIRIQGRAVAVASIELDCGPLSGVEPELLQFAFDAMLASRWGHDCQLILNRPPVRARCSACGNVFSPQLNDFRCDKCGSGSVQVTEGESLILRRVVLESPEWGDCRVDQGPAVLGERITK